MRTETKHPTIGRTLEQPAQPNRRILAALQSAELPLEAPEIELDNAEELRAAAAPVAESVPGSVPEASE